MQLAIIGAGAAGLAAARRLAQRRPDITVTIYEKSRGLGGRAATRRRGDYAFDHGAQYLKAPTPELEALVTRELPADELFDIGKPVWVFDGAGTVAEGDPAQNADPKWSYRPGISQLAKLLGAGADVRREARVAALRRAGPRWSLADAEGRALGEADAVLLTPPAPQSADIVAQSELPERERRAAEEALRAVGYRRCLAVTLAYERLLPRPFYALVNADRAHPIVWLALEHDKGPQRCPPGHSLLVAHLAPQASAERWDEPAEELAAHVAALAGDVLGEDLDQPLWHDRQGWRYALPDGAADPAALDMPEHGIFFAGDYTAGLGRVHLAIEEGWRAAAAIAAARG